MQQSETCLNYEFIQAPFTPNTFSLWRDVNYPNLDPSQLFQFVQIIDQELFQKFLEKVREAYAKKLTYEDLKLDIKYDIDSKKLKQIFETDLKKQIETITIHMSYYQAQIEYAYDLLRRIHIYKFVEYTEQEINQQQRKDQTLYQKYLDKIMKGLITNVQEIATEKIKDFCATGLIKSNSVLESGKSFIKQFIFSGGAAVSKISNFNIGLFIGGIIAEQIVSKVALSIMISRVGAKLDIMHLEIDQMTNELTYINSQLDRLIYTAAEEYPKNLEQHKKNISTFVQKNYKVNVGGDYIYSADTNQVVLKNEFDDCVVLSEQDYQAPQQLSEIQEGESNIINLSEFKVDHF